MAPYKTPNLEYHLSFKLSPPPPPMAGNRTRLYGGRCNDLSSTPACSMSSGRLSSIQLPDDLGSKKSQGYLTRRISLKPRRAPKHPKHSKHSKHDVATEIIPSFLPCSDSIFSNTGPGISRSAKKPSERLLLSRRRPAISLKPRPASNSSIIQREGHKDRTRIDEEHMVKSLPPLPLFDRVPSSPWVEPDHVSHKSTRS